MKKGIICTAAISLFLVFSVARGEDWAERVREGKLLIAKSTLMVEEGKKMKTFTPTDQAWLVDEGNFLIKQGMETLEKSVLASTKEGRSYLREVGAKLRTTGQLLLKLGNKEEDLTLKEEEEIRKAGYSMVGLGELMVQNGKSMAVE